jgi:transcriptional regulator with XRE-family HTH domain
MTKTFGETIREARKQAKISLRKFAVLIEVTPTYVSKIERTEALPPAEAIIARMAIVLNYDFDELMSLANKIPSDILQLLQNNIELWAALRGE